MVLSIVFGGIDPIFRTPLPVWNPAKWNSAQFLDVFDHIFGADGYFGPALLRTAVYVLLASCLCLLVAYPVAYYTARLSGRHRKLLLALLIAPFWISYMMRMLAWVNLLQNDGLVNRVLSLGGLADVSVDWLNGRSVVVVLGLVYGYIPYMILPLYAGLDRLPGSVLEAARDLGAGRVETFRRVTLPLSRPAIIASVLLTCLPMLGDYFTVRPAVRLAEHGDGRQPHQQHRADPRPDRPGRCVRAAGAGRRTGPDAALRPHRAGRGAGLVTALRRWWADPQRPPRILQAVTAAYLLWSLLPVLIAVHVLVQRRAVPDPVAGLLVPLVLGRPGSARSGTTPACTPR